MRADQRGVALITALLVVALATTVAYAMGVVTFTSFQRTASLTDSERSWWYAQGLEDWGRSILERDRAEGDVDHLGEPWAQDIPPLPVEGGVVHGKLVDMQGRFNLNNLAVADPVRSARYVAQFRRLLLCLGDDVRFDAQDIAHAVKDWVDADDEVTFPGGAEDLTYLGLDTPYRAANRPMESVSELLAVKGMTRELYRVLHEHVAALPEPTQVNVNTATEPVLCSMSEDPNAQQRVRAFIEIREERPAETVQELFEGEGVFDAAVDPDDLAVSSRYFLGRAEVYVGSGRIVLYSLFARPDQGTPLVLGRGLDSY